jgi:hypothetical protein
MWADGRRVLKWAIIPGWETAMSSSQSRMSRSQRRGAAALGAAVFSQFSSEMILCTPCQAV